MLNVIDEFTHECLAIRVARKLKAIDVIDVLSDLFILRGVPGHIRSDNGPEFIAKAVQEWISAVGAKTTYIVVQADRSTARSAAPRPGEPCCSTAGPANCTAPARRCRCRRILPTAIRGTIRPSEGRTHGNATAAQPRRATNYARRSAGKAPSGSGGSATGGGDH